MEFWNWLDHNWPTLASSIGIGGGSGFFGKKYLEKQQNKRLTDLETSAKNQKTELDKQKEEIKDVKSKLDLLGQKLDTNTILDKQLRAELKEHRDQLSNRLDRMENRQEESIRQQMTFYKEIINLVQSKPSS